MTCESSVRMRRVFCRQDGIAVFVPGLLPGERARVRIVKPENAMLSDASKNCSKRVRIAPNRSAPSTNAAAAVSASI